MKRIITLIALLFGSVVPAFAQSSEAAGSKMVTGLSIAVILLLGLVIYSNIMLSKHKKLNHELSKRLHELQKK